MARLDTAGFYYMADFFWHKKVWLPPVVPVDPDPVEPVDPCSKCPVGYTCDWNWICIPPENPDPGEQPGKIDNRQPNEDEDKHIIYNPTPQSWYCTQEYSLKSWWSIWWYIQLENGYLTWADYNSWVRYYLSWKDWCWAKVIYEWRIWELDNTWYNRLEFWFWDLTTRNIAISNISSVDARDANDRFRITLKNNWDYLIEVQRVLSPTTAYDWVEYKSWNCLTKWSWWALNYSTPMWMIIWVNGKALLTSTSRFEQVIEQFRELYSSSRWRIVQNVTRKEVTITKDTWESITIMDRNLWATKYYLEAWAAREDWYGNFFQWWNNYPFPVSWATKTSSELVDASWYSYNNPYYSDTFITAELIDWHLPSRYNWSSNDNSNLWTSNVSWWNRWPCPEWYHIPTRDELISLLDMWSYVTGIDRTYPNFDVNKKVQFCKNLLIPLNWYLRFNWWYPYFREEDAILWTCTSQWQWISRDAATGLLATGGWLFAWSYESYISYPIPWWKNCWIWIRAFKNTN